MPGLAGTVWTWRVNPPLPIPPWCNGDALNLERPAQGEFRVAWERFYAFLTPEHRTISRSTTLSS